MIMALPHGNISKRIELLLFFFFFQFFQFRFYFSKSLLCNLQIEATQSKVIQRPIPLLNQKACGTRHPGLLHLLRQDASRKTKNCYRKHYMHDPAVVFLITLLEASRHSEATGVPVATLGSWGTPPLVIISPVVLLPCTQTPPTPLIAKAFAPRP